MDTQKDTPQEMNRAALMAACKGRKMIAGARQLKKALASGKVQAVFAAHLVNGAAGGKMEFPGVRIYNVGNGIF